MLNVAGAIYRFIFVSLSFIMKFTAAEGTLNTELSLTC